MIITMELPVLELKLHEALVDAAASIGFAELWSSDSLFLVACWCELPEMVEKPWYHVRCPEKISFGNGEIWQNMANKWILNIGYSFCFTSNFI